jgi:HEAT repeat protein
MQLLLSFLDDFQAPTAIQLVLGRRRDVTFLRHLLRHVGDEPSAEVRINLRRIESFSWLRDDLSILSALNEDEQRAVVQLATASGINRLQVLEILKHLLVKGSPGSRRAAIASLTPYRGAEANALLLKALQDDDPQTQAAVVGQLRDRGIPNALAMLVDLLDSPAAVVREAAQASLAEFQFQRFLDSFDLLDAEVRRNTGALVKRVDPQAISGLAGELSAPSRTRRLRAIEMAVAMQAIPDLEEELIELLTVEDDLVRTEVLRVLADCDTPRTRRALQDRLLDSNAVVRKAAEATLQVMTEQARVANVFRAEDKLKAERAAAAGEPSAQEAC